MATSEQNKLPPQPVQPGSANTNSTTTTIPYPLPPGIFEGGALFNPLAFTQKVAQLYEHIIVNKQTGESIMQDEAFATLLMRRTVKLDDGTVLFKMVECETPKLTPDGLIIQIEGLKYLRLDCLQDTVAPQLER